MESFQERGSGRKIWFKRRVRRLLVYLLLSMYILLLSGKTFGLPLGLVYVPADVNGWRRGDLLVVASSRFYPLVNESYVVACYPGYWNTACVAGLAVINGVNGVNGVFRVVSFYSGNGLNNGFLRVHVVTPDFAVFNVLFRVPRELAIPLQVLIFTYASYLVYKSVKASTRRAYGEKAVLASLLLILFSVNMTVVGATYVEQARVTYRVEDISVTYEFKLRESELYAYIDTAGVYTVLNATCYIPQNNRNQGNNRNNNQVAIYLNTVLENGKLAVKIPLEVYDELYRKTSENFALTIIPEYLSVTDTLPIRCRVRLNVGEFTFTAVITLHWRDIEVEVREGALCLSNPNPIPIDVRVVIMSEHGSIRLYKLEMDRLEASCIDFKQLEVVRARAIVQYTLLGVTRSRVIQIEQ